MVPQQSFKNRKAKNKGMLEVGSWKGSQGPWVLELAAWKKLQFCLTQKLCGNFPGGSVVKTSPSKKKKKTLPSNSGAGGLIPGKGLGSHIPFSQKNKPKNKKNKIEAIF